MAIKVGLKCLPINIDAFLVDISTHFYLSINSNEEFINLGVFPVIFQTDSILSHVEMRWLSLLRVITRGLELWSALLSYIT